MSVQARRNEPVERRGASIALTQVIRSFGTLHVLEGIDLTIEPGSFVAIVGQSGSGKSTLVQDVLYPALARHFGKATETPGAHERLLGADWLAPFDPVKNNFRNRLGAPDDVFLLGTDRFGRDVLSRLIIGGRATMLITLVAVAMALAAGLVLGLVSGFVVGVVDLALVVGGDGTMLGYGRQLAPHGVPLIGINQGRLGFITDIALHQLEAKLEPMLHGEAQSAGNRTLSDSMRVAWTPAPATAASATGVSCA